MLKILIFLGILYTAAQPQHGGQLDWHVLELNKARWASIPLIRIHT